jgi:hypothetical protein
LTGCVGPSGDQNPYDSMGGPASNQSWGVAGKPEDPFTGTNPYGSNGGQNPYGDNAQAPPKEQLPGRPASTPVTLQQQSIVPSSSGMKDAGQGLPCHSKFADTVGNPNNTRDVNQPLPGDEYVCTENGWKPNPFSK